MKIKPEDYKKLESLIEPEIQSVPLEQAQTIAKREGWSEVRVLWAYYWKAFHQSIDKPEDYEFFRRLSDYLNDSHIETALRNIILK